MHTTDNPQLGRFELREDGDLLGFASYTVRDGVMSVPHTEVDARLRGRGLASTLIRDTLEAARERGLSVLPFCPFVTRYIARHPEYLPLVPPDQHARFGLAPGPDPV
jgi:predicted GNAT family acetyltransferase